MVTWLSSLDSSCHSIPHIKIQHLILSEFEQIFFSNIERIREGIGDKLGLLVRGFAMFIAALVIAFVYQWRLALVMFPVAPITCFIMAELSQVRLSISHKLL